MLTEYKKELSIRFKSSSKQKCSEILENCDCTPKVQGCVEFIAEGQSEKEVRDKEKHFRLCMKKCDPKGSFDYDSKAIVTPKLVSIKFL